MDEDDGRRRDGRNETARTTREEEGRKGARLCLQSAISEEAVCEED